MAGGSDGENIDLIFSWQAAVLFCGFIIITLLWEFGTAVLAYITVRLSGRRALWLKRVKDEILALGVITLTLIVIESPLTKICIPGYDSHAPDPPPCSEGKMQLFSAHLIHEVHILLFEVAIVHIIVLCSSFYISLAKMGKWRKWEKRAREGDEELNLKEEEVLELLAPNRCLHGMRSMWNVINSSISAPVYTQMRLLFRLRMDDAMESQAEKLPRHFNFLNVVEQGMEVEFAEASEHAWMTFVIMAIFLVIPRESFSIYWLSGIGALMVVIVSAKLQSVVVHLVATSYYDFAQEISDWKKEQAQMYSRWTGKDQHAGRDLSLGAVSAGKSADLAHVESAAVKGNQVAPVDMHSTSRARMHVALMASKPHSTNGASTKIEPVELPESHKHRFVHHFRNPEDPFGDITKECDALFWFKSPGLLMWFFQWAFMIMSIAITVTIYGLWRDGEPFIDSMGSLIPIIVLLIFDVCVLIYAALSVLPVYAIVTTVGTTDPHKLFHEIKHYKRVGEEDFEEGVGGKLLMMCCRPEDEVAHMSHDDAEFKEFIQLLTNQAGVISTVAGNGSSASKHTMNSHDRDLHPSVKRSTLYSNFLKAWLEIACKWPTYVKEGRPLDELFLSVKCQGDLSGMRRAFNHIDKDSSGFITPYELASVLKSMGTRATAEELEDMVDELDVDGTESIEFKEFVWFIVFKFFDINNDSYITRDDVAKTMYNLEVDASLEDVERMIDFVMKERSGADMRRRLNLAEFCHSFTSLALVNGDGEVIEGHHGSVKSPTLTAPQQNICEERGGVRKQSDSMATAGTGLRGGQGDVELAGVGIGAEGSRKQMEHPGVGAAAYGADTGSQRATLREGGNPRGGPILDGPASP